MGDSTPQAANAATSTRALLFGRWLAGFLVAAFFMLFDPFGIGQTSSRASEDIVLAAIAPLTSDPARATPGQQRITVVLIDDALLDGLSKELGRRVTWPMSRMDQLAYIYGPILDRAPSAMFVDVVLHQDAAASGSAADDLAAFAQGLASRQDRIAFANRPRLIFADRPRATDSRAGCSFRRTSPAALIETSHVAPAFRSFVAQRPDMEFAVSRSWGPANRYPLAPLALGSADAPDSICAPFPTDAQLIASPALALYSHWCEQAGRRSAPCAAVQSGRAPGTATSFPLHHVPAELAAASAPVWRWFQSPAMQQLQARLLPDDDPCRRLNAQSPFAALWRALRLRAADETQAGFNPCYAIDTLSAADIARLQGKGLDDATLDRFLKNRLVLVGTQLDSAPDRMPSPVNGVASGVMWHAVALENLLTDGNRRTADALPWHGIDLPLAFALCLAALLAVPLNFLTDPLVARLSSAGHRWHPAMRWLAMGLILAGVFVLTLAIPLILAVALFKLTGWAPVNWMPILFAKLLVGTAIARTVSVRYGPHLDRIRGWPAALGGDRPRSYIMAGIGLTLAIVLISVTLAF